MLMQSCSSCAFFFTHAVGWPQPVAHPPAHPAHGTSSRIATLPCFAYCLLTRARISSALTFLSPKLVVKISSCCMHPEGFLCCATSLWPRLCASSMLLVEADGARSFCWDGGYFHGTTLIRESCSPPANAISSQDLSACSKHLSRLRE